MDFPVYTIRLVRESTGSLDPGTLVSSSSVFELAKKLLGDLDREQFWVLLLDTKQKVVGLNQVAVGTLDGCLVHPREVFKAAIVASAASIIAFHNHPSGDPKPSVEDAEITARLADAGRILGVPLLDSIVIGEERYYSYKDHGVL